MMLLNMKLDLINIIQCGEIGHIARNCSKSQSYGNNYGGGYGGGGGAGKTCYSCGGYGHMSRMFSWVRCIPCLLN